MARKSFVRKEGIKAARLVVIAAEGRETENIYFEAMKSSLHASRVHVEVLHRDSDNSSPEEVFRQIQAFVKEYDIDDDDQLWVVVDRDKWTAKMLSDVATKCAQNKYFNFCVSNPCFELWLILHLEDVMAYSPEDKNLLKDNKKVNNNDTWTTKRLRDLMNGKFHKSNYDAESLLSNIDDAISRAEILDVNPNDRWPQGIGTRVYRVAKSILGR